MAKHVGCKTIGFTGELAGQLGDIADECICIPSPETARIQEGHIIVGHYLCEALDDVMS